MGGDPDNLGMAIGGSESPPRLPGRQPDLHSSVRDCIRALWTFLGRIDLEPSTPFKFPWAVAVGLASEPSGTVPRARRTGHGGARMDLLGYLLHTTGSSPLPVGLSMVTGCPRRAW